MVTIAVPDFKFSGQYYPEILEDLIQYLRQYAPELSDEDPAEPAQQLLRAFALSAHLNNALLDLVANEMFLPTAKLRSSVSELLALIDYQLDQASPASVDVLYKLTKTFNTNITVVPAGSLFATEDTRAAEAIVFEVLEDKNTIRTDQVDKVYAYNPSGGAYTDHSAEAKTPAGTFTPAWGAVPAAGSALYIGHHDILWDQIDINIDVAAADITAAVWEYYDGDWDQGIPDSVVNQGSDLLITLDGILGTSNRAGTTIRVQSNVTGVYEDIVSTWPGQNQIVTSGFLGQAVPSTDPEDYTVGAAWREMEDIEDDTDRLTTAGDNAISYTLPQTISQNWRKTTIPSSGALAYEAYWIRFRVISVGGAESSPDILEVRISDGKQYQVLQATQGQSQEDDPLGSSTGLANQQYELSKYPVLDDSYLKIFVTESGVEREYTKQSDFLNSTSVDRHFTADFDDDGVCEITFGDGTNGKIPPAGVDNIRSEYRTMDDSQDGNVGAGMVVINQSGVSYVTEQTNPRAGTGFETREGLTESSLALTKVEGPASLRTQGRGVGPDDVVTLTNAFTDAAGTRPFARCLAIEEAFGVKTIEAVVVGTGGVPALSTSLDELEDYFNGTDTQEGVIVMNHQLTATNFTPKTIDVTATVEGGSQAAIETALTTLINPLAVDEDGAYIWEFGGEVPLAKLIQEIMNTTPAPRDVTISVPGADVPLGTRELPTVGTLSITVNP